MRLRAEAAGWVCLCAAALSLGARAPAAVPELRKGWIEAPSAGALLDLPPGVRVVEPYAERAFVELAAGAVAALAARGLVFHPFDDADLLSVGDWRFDVRAGEPALSPDWRAAAAGAEPRRPFVVKFEAPFRPEWLDALRATGAEIVQYQPHFGVLVLAPTGSLDALRGVGRVAFAGEYHAAYKADTDLRARAGRDETLTLRLVLFDVPGWEGELGAAAARGARVAHLSQAPSTSQWAVVRTAILENVRTRDLPAILRAPSVYWAEPWYPPFPDDERSAQAVAGNHSAFGVPAPGYSDWLAAVGADGSGVTVAVADTGLDTGLLGSLHPDFAGRVDFATALCAQNRDRSGHGTNVTSVAAGDPRPPTGTGSTDAGGFLWGQGVAPGASIYFQKAVDGVDCPLYINQANILAQDAVHVGGAEIGNHSFTDGLGAGNTYNAQAQAWDARVRDADPGVAGNQPYAVVFSAGNSGPGSGTLTSPKAAKNIVTVGATENFQPGVCPGIAGCGGPADDIDYVIDFSSRGPTSDGRIKPDVVAPGHVVAGAKGGGASYDCTCDGGGQSCCASVGVDGANLYTTYSGTSQASPGVAGASAIVFDWFAAQYGGFPSPAMNKAMLINGAVDLKTPDAPNINEGWGRVRLADSLAVTSARVDQSFVVGTTGDGGAFAASYYPQDPALPMKASLVWTDAPGAVSCNPCLVNDLDLVVTQGATTWRGNNFTAGFSNTSTTTDTRNNVEGVRLPAGTLGCAPFEVRVRASALNGDGVPGNADTTDQDFALVVANAAATPGPPVLDVVSSAVSGGCDGDGFLDRRETANLQVTLGNPGCGGATGLTAVLGVEALPDGAAVTVSPSGPVPVGAIAAGATAVANWSVTLADAPVSWCGGKVTLRIDLVDDAARSWSRTIDVELDGDGFATTSVVDPADTDLSFAADPEWSLQSCRTTSAPTSWHMGQSDCSGIARDAATHDLVFAQSPGVLDRLAEVEFRHAWDGYSNASFADRFQVELDPEDDGSFVTLQSWTAGPTEPGQMVAAGPIDVSALDATRGPTVKLRFRFTSAAPWAGPNQAIGWDVDDITLRYDTLQCDAGACPACPTYPPPLADVPPGSGPLRVARAGGDLTLSWPEQECAVRYNVYQGTLGDFASHAIFTAAGLDGADSCFEPGTSVTFAAPAGDLYFLVAADNGTAESSLGASSVADPRPYAVPSCSPHE